MEEGYRSEKAGASRTEDPQVGKVGPGGGCREGLRRVMVQEELAPSAVQAAGQTPRSARLQDLQRTLVQGTLFLETEETLSKKNSACWGGRPRGAGPTPMI